jgi:hypothetical protein
MSMARVMGERAVAADAGGVAAAVLGVIAMNCNRARGGRARGCFFAGGEDEMRVLRLPALLHSTDMDPSGGIPITPRWLRMTHRREGAAGSIH